MQHFSQILQNKLLPWSKNGVAQRIVVARPRMNMAMMPPEANLIYREIPGKRKIVKGERLYGNTRQISAEWPEAGMHEVENSRFICVVDGQVNYQVGNYLLTCNAGDFILIPPKLPHPGNRHFSRLVHSNIPGKSCLLLFMLQYRRGFQCWLSEYEGDLRKDSASENYLFLNEQVVQLFRLLVDEISNQNDGFLCDSLMLSFAASLLREVSAGHYLHPGSAVKMESSEAKNEFVEDLEIYIGKHINERLSLEAVSRHFYMSRAQLVRRMRSETGQTFVEFLTAYRMREAKTLLHESEWTAQAIAKFLGFKSPAYFHHLFVRQAGCTPGEYRLKNRAD